MIVPALGDLRLAREQCAEILITALSSAAQEWNAARKTPIGASLSLRHPIAIYEST